MWLQVGRAKACHGLLIYLLGMVVSLNPAHEPKGQVWVQPASELLGPDMAQLTNWSEAQTLHAKLPIFSSK